MVVEPAHSCLDDLVQGHEVHGSANGYSSPDQRLDVLDLDAEGRNRIRRGGAHWGNLNWLGPKSQVSRRGNEGSFRLLQGRAMAGMLQALG